MKIKNLYQYLGARLALVSFPFLLFLIGVVHVKVYVKLASIVLYGLYLLYKRVSLPRRLNGPIYFYLLMIPLGIVSAFCNDVGMNPDYWRGFAVGAAKWLAAASGLFLLGVSLKRIANERVLVTIKAFFLLNALASFADLVSVMIRSKRWIPYWINDSTQFGISTGDYIHGLTRDVSIANAALNVTGILFFLFHKDLKWLFLCIVILVLCTSNFSMLLLFACLAAVIVLINDRRIRLYALGSILCTMLLYGFLSMQNVIYANKTINQELAATTAAGQKEEGDGMEIQVSGEGTRRDAQAVGTAGTIGVSDVVRDLRWMHSEITRKDSPGLDTGLARLAVRSWYGVSYDSSRLGVSGMPGKLYALRQTGAYMVSNPGRFFLGAGPGNFSSNLAIKMTGLGVHGSYSPGHIYVHQDFLEHHLYIWMYVFAHTAEFHSVTQLPANTYSQVGGEYGAIGLMLFGVLYVGFFLKRAGFRPSALILIAMLLGYFFVDYWFEAISLTVFFELLMLAEWWKKQPD